MSSTMDKENPSNSETKVDYDEISKERRDEKKEFSESKRGDYLQKSKGNQYVFFLFHGHNLGT